MHAYQVFSPAPIESHPLQPVDMPLPEPGPNQARLRVLVCGVCHTDLHIVEGDITAPRYPLTPGHQVVGKVDALGPSLSAAQPKQIQIQQRVGLPWLHWACGQCEFCQRGLENLCPQARFTGFSVNGGFAQYVLAETSYLLPLPDEIPDEQAAPLLCAGIVGYRALKKAEIQPGERVGLFGFGASAHLCLQVLRYWGCEVYVFSRSPSHRQHALALGAVQAVEPGNNPVLLDKAVVFAPAGQVVIQALEAIRPGGIVSINAIHMSDIPAFPYAKLWGERQLRSVANATYQDGEEFLALAVAANLRATVNLYPFSQANAALEDLKYSRFDGQAVLRVS
ncbi:MAG: alcohol dehydrogenase [Anaerolineae bacterium]|nr:MAG: alcohol dehydrogenase [Anaerolineae bacterium]